MTVKMIGEDLETNPTSDPLWFVVFRERGLQDRMLLLKCSNKYTARSMVPDPKTTGLIPLVGFCCWEAATEVLASLVPDPIKTTGLLRLPCQVDVKSIKPPALWFSWPEYSLAFLSSLALLDVVTTNLPGFSLKFSANSKAALLSQIPWFPAQWWICSQCLPTETLPTLRTQYEGFWALFAWNPDWCWRVKWWPKIWTPQF